MKKIIFALAMSLVACSAKSTSYHVEHPSCSDADNCNIPKSVDGTLLSTPSWEMVVPNGFTVLNSPNPVVQLSYGNSQIKTVIILVKENYSDTSEDYANRTILDMSEINIKFVSKTQADINGQTYTLLQGIDVVDPASDALPIRYFVWTTTKNNFGYSLYCGGVSNTTNDQFKICSNIASTLKLR